MFPPEYHKESINDVFAIKVPVHQEERGCLYTIYDTEYYNSVKIKQEKISITEDGWGRGLHADEKNWKLISCVAGQFDLILLDGRTYSNTYGKKIIYRLKYNKGLQIIVPPGVYNGHLATDGQTTLHYAWSHGYEGPEAQKTVSFFDSILEWTDDDLETLRCYSFSHRDMNETIPFSEAGFL